MNHDGHAYDGIVYSQNLKKVPKPGFSTIKNIISFSRKKNSFKVTFQNFPSTYQREISSEDIENFHYNQIVAAKLRNYGKN